MKPIFILLSSSHSVWHTQECVRERVRERMSTAERHVRETCKKEAQREKRNLRDRHAEEIAQLQDRQEHTRTLSFSLPHITLYCSSISSLVCFTLCLLALSPSRSPPLSPLFLSLYLALSHFLFFLSLYLALCLSLSLSFSFLFPLSHLFFLTVSPLVTISVTCFLIQLSLVC